MCCDRTSPSSTMWAGLDRAQAGPDSPSTLDTMCTPPPMIEDSKECPFPPSPSHKGRHSRRTREGSDGRRRAGTSPNADRQQVCNDTHAFACMHAPITPHTRTNTEAPTVNVHTLIYSWQNKQRQQGTIPRGGKGKKKEKKGKKKDKRERERESRRGIGSERERERERETKEQDIPPHGPFR